MDLSSTLYNLDKAVFRSLNLAGTNPALDAIMVVFTFLGATYIMPLLSVPLWIRGKKELAFDLLVLMLVASLLSLLIKIIVGRERPYDVLSGVNGIAFAGVSRESDSSFPSAHAARAFALAVFLSYGRPRVQAVALTGFAIMIGISRIYLGVHWPSDILAGALLGAVSALLVLRLGQTSGRYSRFRSRGISILDRAFSKILSRKQGARRVMTEPNCLP